MMLAREKPVAFVCSLLLAAASLTVFFLRWSHYGYAGTATMGAGAVAIGCLTYAFCGVIFGGVLIALIHLVSLARKTAVQFKLSLFNAVWAVFALSALYQELGK